MPRLKESMNAALRQLILQVMNEWKCKISSQFAVRSSQHALRAKPEGSAVSILLFDLYGHAIKEFEDIISFPYNIDIAYLSNGIYFLRVMDEEGVIETLKFLKIAE